jgi:hypothetical protein
VKGRRGAGGKAFAPVPRACKHGRSILLPSIRYLYPTPPLPQYLAQPLGVPPVAEYRGPRGADPIYNKALYQYSNHAIHNSSLHPPTMQALRSFFGSPAMMAMMASLTRSKGLSAHNSNPSWYKRGDHILLHNDNVKKRRLSYILHLGRCDGKGSWDGKREGGRLHWCGEDGTYINCAFNTLTLFAVSSRSYHFVEPVWREPDESGCRRLAVSGFYFAEDDDLARWGDFAEQSELSGPDAGFYVRGAERGGPGR